MAAAARRSNCKNLRKAGFKFQQLWRTDLRMPPQSFLAHSSPAAEVHQNRQEPQVLGLHKYRYDYLRISAPGNEFAGNVQICKPAGSASARYIRHNSDEFICSGDLNQQQALYESLPKCCPLLKKLWVSNLKVINIGFIADLRQL